MMFIFEHKPIPKIRHRHTKKGFSYDPQHNEKMSVRKKMQAQFANALNSESKPIQMQASNLALGRVFHVDLHFYLEIPKSDASSVRNIKKWGILKANIKPDIDNLMKFYLDCANGVLFTDDSMIVSSTQTKSYSPYEKPRVVMTITSKKDALHPDIENALKVFGPDKVKELRKCCHFFNTFAYDDFLERRTDESQTKYLQEIGNALLEFADTWAVDLNKIKRKRNRPLE